MVALKPSHTMLSYFILGLLALQAITSVHSFDYGDALDKTLLFLEAQRSGKLPETQRVKWRADSGLEVNLVGGYYDAGDHVKFGLPMAYSVTLLSWAAVDFSSELVSLNQMEHTLEAIKWGTDYFIKAHPQPFVLWGQVGDGASDHYCWERAEDMSTPRTAYRLDPQNPGSDLAGETAAALASASIAFKPYDSAYSALLLVHAFIARSCSMEPVEHTRARCLLLQCSHDSIFQKLNFQEWNNLQFPASASFLLSVYSDYLTNSKSAVNCPNAQVQPQELLNFAKSQADYILGQNPKSMSYLVGFGQNYPGHVHHRGASIPSDSVLKSVVGCVDGFDEWYNRKEANPNVVHGGLVGGPDNKDEYSDDRANYEQSEPTLSGTAPLVGVFSKLQSLPVEFVHSITNTWTVGKETYYHHKVLVKNVCGKPITELRLHLEKLTGSLWGLSPTQEKNVYGLPEWLKVLQPGSDFTFVYIQGGAQASVVVQSYH